jgi:GH15 family glucan-1,4-alpha-glucosidase
MAMWALADLDTLLLGDGALLAGASAKWDYVWPRDAAFGAAALAAAGHPNDAEAVLGFLQRVQGEDGGFEVATNRTDRLWRMGAGLNRTVRV